MKNTIVSFKVTQKCYGSLEATPDLGFMFFWFDMYWIIL